ncbi:putative replication initiation protein [Acinetobacter phage BS46]|nr:putative replication initiation protein [Acinetobacter phage BS46]
MSFKYTKSVWSFSFNGKNRAIKKLIMLNLADRAGDDGLCFPSVAKIAEDTLLDRRTIMTAITSMIEEGLLEDTKMRKGQTKQVRVLRILIDVEDDNKSLSDHRSKKKEDSGTVVPHTPKIKPCHAKNTFKSNVSSGVSESMKKSFEEQGKPRDNVVKGGVPESLKHLLKRKKDVVEESNVEQHQEYLEDFELTQSEYDECDAAMSHSLNNPIEYEDKDLTLSELVGSVFKQGASEDRKKIYQMGQIQYKFSEDY